MSENDQNSRKAYDQIWAQWSPESIAEQIKDHRNRRTVYLDLIDRWIPEATDQKVRILEIGCGTGIDAHMMAQAENREVFAIDISEESIRKAYLVSEHFKEKAALSVRDCTRMDFPSESFDLVFSQGVLEHFTDPYPAIDEQMRVLNPGGILVISVPQTFSAYTVYKHLSMLMKKWPWGWEREFSYWGLRRIAKKYRLKIMATAGYDYWRHISEPAWVMRSMDQKRKKLSVLKRSRMLDRFFSWYNNAFDRLEKRLGCFFMKNIVFVYKKEGVGT